jgi:hypothetical protein
MHDKTFRQWRETAWVYLPWDQVNSELYNDAMHLGLQIKLNQNGKLLSTKTAQNISETALSKQNP